MSGAENGAERPENRVERSGELAWEKNDGAERSAEREVAERERSVSGLNWLLTARSNVIFHGFNKFIIRASVKLFELGVRTPGGLFLGVWYAGVSIFGGVREAFQFSA